MSTREEKLKQLKALCAVCRKLGADVQCHPEHCYFTAMIWEGWGIPYNEAPAAAIQQQIQRQTAQYPDLVCYCFDPFSTLVYAL